jgi:hypothetical protein
MDIPQGWSFYSADFSMLAMGSGNSGSVTLIRDEEGRKKWHKLPDCIKDCAEECPPLYVYGTGATIEAAFVSAHHVAAHAMAVPNL